MESANFHLHQQEDHHLVTSSFSWSQNPILNGTNNIINLRTLDASTNSSVQDFRFPYNSMGYPIENIVSHELQCRSRIKDEFSVAESYPKFLELLNGSPTSNSEDVHLQPYSVAESYSKIIELLKDSPMSNTEDIHLHPYSTYLKNNDHQQISYSNNGSRGTLSQIFPTISVPSLNQCTTTTSSSSSSSTSSSSAVSSTSFDMNCLPPLNLFGSPRFDHGNLNYDVSLNTHNHGDISYGFDRMLQPNQRPSACPNKMTRVSTTGRIDQSAKRPASKYVDAKETQSVAPKKSKLEPRSSSAPFQQVRKEKLGDKIAAIQQLVAPFGKTDTASVLMEAIGYIKFLQTQVETLSVPYMKSTTNKIDGISSERGRMEEDGDITDEVKRDLRSRGLCLVPLSCLSYVTDGCEGMWPHHNHLT
ncbi:transcription factor bHLH110 isoform X1 [Helianthus annuus]|uniref:transcription factor bHLH110 isoform X1 n=1 Tax=Helianthus annuus TaxID=4232 RepID=UPI000B8F48D2|nr:transcription factor bHLH110 isoform X1 [Helianthus annuus]XP_022016435.1 transcription factor bHLH110 isoform X1 [Helianthus annuus]XP_035841913.1 transcription factor bHLH110 isoform X1 [Helianthus annuus]